MGSARWSCARSWVTGHNAERDPGTVWYAGHLELKPECHPDLCSNRRCSLDEPGIGNSILQDTAGIPLGRHFPQGISSGADDFDAPQRSLRVLDRDNREHRRATRSQRSEQQRYPWYMCLHALSRSDATQSEDKLEHPTSSKRPRVDPPLSLEFADGGRPARYRSRRNDMAHKELILALSMIVTAS